MSNVGGTSWGASLPQQPVRTGRQNGPGLEPKPLGKQPPAVVVVQKALVEHLQRAYPILDGSIVQLIVEDQGEDNIDEAVKILSSLAANAEKEAAASSAIKASLSPTLKEKDVAVGNCVDDKIAMEMAIAASLAEQKQHSADILGHGTSVGLQDTACWDTNSGWEIIDPSAAAEWGAIPSSNTSWNPTGAEGLVSSVKAWEPLPADLNSVASFPDHNLPAVQSERPLVLPEAWATDWTSPQSSAPLQAVPNPQNHEMEAVKGPGVQAMAAVLGEDWALEPLWSSSSKLGYTPIEKRDPGVERPGAQDLKGKAKAKPYMPRIAVGPGEIAGRRPYSPRITNDDALSKADKVVAHQSSKQVEVRGKMVVARSELEDDEAEILKQLKALFPDVMDDVICRAYIDAGSDANKAAEALFRLVEKPSLEPDASLSGGVNAAEEVGESSDSLSKGEGSVNLNATSSFFGSKPPSPARKEQSSETPSLLSAAGGNTAFSASSHVVPSRQHPRPFQEDDSDIEQSKSIQSRPVSPVFDGGSATSMSTVVASAHSSAAASPVTSPKTRRKGKRKGRRSAGSASSSGSSSDEDAKSNRRDMVDFMVSMLGGSMAPAVVKGVIENLKGDFQQSLKCLLSMSAGSEGGIIEEDFGAMTDTSEGGGNQFENLSRAGLDDEEDPVATLVNIFGNDKVETIEQVLKEKGGNVGDAATILMAMFESDKGSASESDLQLVDKDEEQPPQEEDDEDPSFKINEEQLMAHFPLADKGGVRSLLRITNNSFEATAKMLCDSGLMPRGLDVASLSAPPTFDNHFSANLSLQTRPASPLSSDTRFRPSTPPYANRGRPPGHLEAPIRQPPQAHHQPLFSAAEFPEIGDESALFREAPAERAQEFTGHNALFLKNRSATNKHWRACQYFFSEAARARANREFSRAEALKEEGRKHKRLAEAANQVASSRIFSEKNKTIRNTIKIDVHGQLVQEALAHVDNHLKNLANLTTISFLSIITGRGLHSENGKAKILPAVQKYLRDRGYSFYQENPGCIVVDLKAERHVPSGPSSAEDADDRPSSAESLEERPGRLEGAGNGQASFRKLTVA